jgi:hypothetical protein
VCPRRGPPRAPANAVGEFAPEARNPIGWGERGEAPYLKTPYLKSAVSSRGSSGSSSADGRTAESVCQ